MRLDRWRQQAEVSVVDLSAKLGVSRATIYRWESGEQMPRPAVIRQIVSLTKGKVLYEDFNKANIAWIEAQSD
jgi:transcriptional regulator with XRE-family HTH domain